MTEEEEEEGGRSCFQFKQRDIYSGVQLHGRRSIRCPGEDFEPFPWTTSQPCPFVDKGTEGINNKITVSRWIYTGLGT